MYKEFLKLSNEKNKVLKGQNIKHTSKMDMQMTNKHMKWHSISYFIVVNCLVQLFCNPMDFSLPGPSVHEISQSRTLE